MKSMCVWGCACVCFHGVGNVVGGVLRRKKRHCCVGIQCVSKPE